MGTFRQSIVRQNAFCDSGSDYLRWPPDCHELHGSFSILSCSSIGLYVTAAAVSIERPKEVGMRRERSLFPFEEYRENLNRTPLGKALNLCLG